MRSAAARPRVALFDADTPPALVMARALGQAGVAVEVFASGPGSVAGLSRQVQRVRRCPPLDDGARFVPWLQQQLEHGDIDLVAPTSDLLVFYLAELWSSLGERARAALPDPEALRCVLFKDRFHAACQRLGVATPWQRSPGSVEEALADAEQLPYPLVIKPRSHIAAAHLRGQVVHDPGELRRAYRPCQVPPGQRGLLLRYPEQRWPVLQAYRPCPGGQLIAISGVLDRDGRPLAVSTARKLAQWPAQLGVGIDFCSHDDDALQTRGVTLARQLLGRGLFELEFLCRGDGEPLALDLNPRAFGQLSLNHARGHDLALLWYRLSCGQQPPARATALAQVQWRHAVPFHLQHWLWLARGPDRRAELRRYWRALRAPHVDIVHSRHDPLPGLLFAAKMLRHPRALARALDAPPPATPPGTDP